jgi:uncharacterized protein (UPF0254 family)
MRITLRARIFIAMFMVVVLGFGATGVISLLHFKAEESEYRRDRLKRKEEAVEAHVAYELKRALGSDIGQGGFAQRAARGALCHKQNSSNRCGALHHDRRLAPVV